jgi:hypothetical protein
MSIMTIVSTPPSFPSNLWPQGRTASGREHAFDVIAAFAARFRSTSAQALRAESLNDCELVIRARLNLAYCLIESGWWPSQPVSDGLLQDELLLAEGNGSFERFSVAGASSAAAG